MDDQTEITVSIYEDIPEKQQLMIYKQMQRCFTQLKQGELPQVLIDEIIEYVGSSAHILLGTLSMEILPKPKGETKVKITFELDANYWLSVTTTETNDDGSIINEKKINVWNQFDFTQQEVNRMIDFVRMTDATK